MSKITFDPILFNDTWYELAKPFNLVHSRHLGLDFSKKRSIDPYRFQPEFEIKNDQLYLMSVACGLDYPEKWFIKLRTLLFKYPPRINGREPVEDTNVDGYSCGFFRYHELYKPIRYTGDLVIGLGDSRDQDCGIDIDDPFTYVELITITLEKGKVLKSKKQEGKSVRIPNKPRPGINTLQDLLKKNKKE